MKKISFVIIIFLLLTSTAFAKVTIFPTFRQIKDIKPVPFIAGFVSCIVVHELGHMAAYEIAGIDYEFYWLGFHKERPDYKSTMAGPVSQFVANSILVYKYPKSSFTKGFTIGSLFSLTCPGAGDYEDKNLEWATLGLIGGLNFVFLEW